MNVTSEGIQFLQGLTQPIGVVSITGPSHLDKSKFASALLKRYLTLRPDPFPETRGIWIWSEALVVNKPDEMGRDQSFNSVVLYHEGLFSYSNDATSIGFTLALLMSSQIVHITSGELSKEELEKMSFCAELLTSIQIV
jgi:hypothetical protein